MNRMKLDALSERFTRRLAGTVSRRSFLSRFGAVLTSAPLLPVLPVARAAVPKADSAFTRNAQTTDPKKCTYWRYCAIDGMLCTCCGGGLHTCPPGTTPSPTSWVGTCVYPQDGKSYLIAYRDCCGALACRTKCSCDSSDRDMPVYRAQADNDIVWCIGLSTMNYHCTTAAFIGLAE